MSTTPQVSYDPTLQRREALRNANRTRVWRCKAKRDVAAGDVTATQVLTSRAPRADGMRVLDLLLSIRMVGVMKADTVMRKIGIAPTKRIGELTDRQRYALVRWLDGR